MAPLTAAFWAACTSPSPGWAMATMPLGEGERGLYMRGLEGEVGLEGGAYGKPA